MVGDVHDIIMCAKFKIEIFMCYDFTGGGVEFSIFLLIFAWALEQCSANALPVISVPVLWIGEFYCLRWRTGDNDTHRSGLEEFK